MIKRVQKDLEDKTALWLPVSDMCWTTHGVVPLNRDELIGAIARALNIDDRGTQEEVETRLAQEIANRCLTGRTVIFDLMDVITPRVEGHAEALVTLVQELWVDLMEAASHISDLLPVFLLISIAYPKPIGFFFNRTRRQAKWAKIAIGKIKKKVKLRGKTRVEVLDELKPIKEEYVIEFLEVVLDMEPALAHQIAQNMINVPDNEGILANMKQLLEGF